jgi:hypothetical protein
MNISSAMLDIMTGKCAQAFERTGSKVLPKAFESARPVQSYRMGAGDLGPDAFAPMTAKAAAKAVSTPPTRMYEAKSILGKFEDLLQAARIKNGMQPEVVTSIDQAAPNQSRYIRRNSEVLDHQPTIGTEYYLG